MSHLLNHGIIEVATLTPTTIQIGNPRYNVDKMLELFNSVLEKNESGERQTRIVVYPELCITGYTCSDLFNQSMLLNSAKEELRRFIDSTRHEYCPIIFVGIPIRKDNQLFNCAVAIHNGKVLGVIPKTFIPNYGVYYEARYFKSAYERLNDEIQLYDERIPFTETFLIEDQQSGAIIAAEICEDLWVPIPPSSYHTLYGANIIVNLSASNETIGKTYYRQDLVKMQSANCMCGYVYASATSDESTTDTVFSGHCIIAENGIITAETKFMENQDITYGEIDIEKCINERVVNSSFMLVEGKLHDYKNYKHIYLKTFNPKLNVFKANRKISLFPFVPTDIDSRSEEILSLQAIGLAQRLKKIHCEKVVVGISGGLDSTLALIVCIEAFKINNYNLKGIIGITMPCFGTTSRTLNNAISLMKALGITYQEISIKEACLQHYKDIGHDINVHDITFENVQARERTQVLMDIANKFNAIVVGTGDLSELALGWCTYNGDQMSMYGVNASVPKTLIRSIVHSYAKKQKDPIKATLLDICDTPISPELLPPNADGTIAQKTEDAVGSYVVHDFILYYMLRYGFGPKKIYDLFIHAMTQNTSCNKEDNMTFGKEKVLKDMRIFYRRFFTQQFKRSCMPDGIKVGSVSLSPRGDWRMPSDASYEAWLRELDTITN